MENYNQKEENIETQKMYEALKSFFKMDMKLKEAMSRLAPTELDDYNEETRIEYTDKLDKFFKETEIELSIMSQKFGFGLEVSEAIKNHFNKAKESLLIGSYKKGIGQDVYIKQISGMDEKLVEEVKEKFVGYTMESPDDLVELINKSKSINELLHVMHSYIINNDEILQAMPNIDEKENRVTGDSITLYGEPTELSQKIFDDFPINMDCGYTDIISMENRIIMMIRDRGHALTIDIDNTDKENDILVKYFVPKLCNVEMIKKLPGIGKISQNGATGMFESKKEEISKNLFNFIEKVPTDLDIPNIHEHTETFDEHYDEQIEEENKQEEKYLFENEDARKIAMEVNENGVRIGRIAKLQERIKTAIKEIKNKLFKNSDGKEVEGDDGKTTRD